ncbi:MAG: SPOR domain-containing protein [Prolixibacteraceae bacterium]|jgi:cell division protein FtsN|nr:SPOR domain-containing protein [Prolixibacteraceae bacterium]
MRIYVIISVVFILIVAGCRKKPADDYDYYEPAEKDKATEVVDTTKNVAVKESEPKVKEEVVKPVDVDAPYFIVVASYTVKDFAITQKEVMEAEGLKPAIIMTNDDGWYKLAVQSFDSIESARKSLKELKEKGGIYSGAMIVYKK